MLNKSKQATESEMHETAMLGLVMGSDAILVSERRGQQDLVAQASSGKTANLPVDFNGDRNTLDVLKEWGVIVKEDPSDAKTRGDLFFEVELPEGWRIEPTDHSMWTKLVDALGYERAMIFYKAAFYDRSAHMNIRRFWQISKCPLGGWEGVHEWEKAHSSEKLPYVSYVEASDRFVSPYTFEVVRVFESEPAITAFESFKDASGKVDWTAHEAAEKALVQQARDWLNEHYPEWESYMAYWDTVPVAITPRERPA